MTTHFGMNGARIALVERQVRRRCVADASSRNARRASACRRAAALRVGVDQQLVRVEAMAVRRRRRAVHAVAVELPGRSPADSRARPRGYIPAARCAPISRLPSASNRQSSTASALAREEREVDAAAVPGRAQRPAAILPSTRNRARLIGYPIREPRSYGERRQRQRRAKPDGRATATALGKPPPELPTLEPP